MNRKNMFVALAVAAGALWGSSLLLDAALLVRSRFRPPLIELDDVQPKVPAAPAAGSVT